MDPVERDNHAEFATDFGGLRHAVPKAVHRMPAAFPARLLSSGVPLTLRGSGHSCDGQTVTEHELLVTYSPGTAAPQLRDLGHDLVEVPAGMSWHGVESWLNRRGRTVGVLTGDLHMSVGGTLSVGGVGLNSVRSGLQCDQVERIQLIDGTGTARWCSRAEHSELFRFALGGLGTVGLIERVVLRTVQHRRYVHIHQTRHTAMADLAENAERIAACGGVDLYGASLRRGILTATTGWYSDDPRRCDERACMVVPNEPFGLRDSATRYSAGSPDDVRLWTDYLVPAGQFARMLTAVDAVRNQAPLDRTLKKILVLMVGRGGDAPPFAFAPVGSASATLGVGMYTIVDRHDHETVAAIRRIFRILLEQCCELGGRPYLYGVNELDRPLMNRLYGTDLNRLAQLRSLYRLEHINAHIPLVRAK